jgi:hypothetical protein
MFLFTAHSLINYCLLYVILLLMIKSHNKYTLLDIPRSVHEDSPQTEPCAAKFTQKPMRLLPGNPRPRRFIAIGEQLGPACDERHDPVHIVKKATSAERMLVRSLRGQLYRRDQYGGCNRHTSLGANS